MSGLALNMGAFGSGYASAGTPAAALQPTGPTTIGEKAFGVVTGGSGVRTVPGLALMSVGTLALLGLVCLWWSLPR